MATVTELLTLYSDFMTTKLEMKTINTPLLELITESLGAAVHDADASLVACSNKAERADVKNTFLIETLALPDTKELDAAIDAVCKKMGASNRKKYRVVFYYLLLEHFKLENIFLTKFGREIVESVSDSKTPSSQQQHNMNLDSTKPANSNFDAAMQQYKEFFTGTLKVAYDESLLQLIAQSLGTAIYHPDASLVACSDNGELSRVKESFLIETLNLPDAPNLMEAIKKVCTRMGSSNRRKYRTVFYYLLLEELGLEKSFAQKLMPSMTETVAATPIVEHAAETVAAAPVVEHVAETVAAAPVVEHIAETVAAVPVVEHVAETVAATPVVEHVTAPTMEHTPTISHSITETVPQYPVHVEQHDIDHNLLTSIGHSVGVNVYTDSTPVNLHDHEERERIKHHFLIGKLGLDHTEHLEHAMSSLASQVGNGQNRAFIYYHLVKHFGKENAITQPTNANLY